MSKVSSKKLAALAARILDADGSEGAVFWSRKSGRLRTFRVTHAELKALAGSVLSQAEQPEEKPKKARARK